MKAFPHIPASPRARRAMRQRGLDPAAVHGTGPGGRIVEADVLHAAALVGRSAAAQVSESFATVPHFYLHSEVDVTSLVQLRNQIIEDIQQRCGHRPSLTDFLLRAMVLALRDCPQANRIWQNDTIVALPRIDVGLVAGTVPIFGAGTDGGTRLRVALVGHKNGAAPFCAPDGLLTPVIRQADRLSMVELVRQRAELVAAVRRKTPVDASQGAAASLANLGKYRVDHFVPILSPPQSSMLAVGRVAKRPVAFEGRIGLRDTIHLTLAVDHRVMGGVPAAEFLDRIVDYLERPFLLLCNPPPNHF